jgi:hypothetical protein
MSTPIFDVVADFDTDPTGANSSDRAFKQWATALKHGGRAPPMGNSPIVGGHGIIPAGTYVGLTSYDLTLSNGVSISCAGSYGAVLYADGQAISAPVFDFTGCSWIKVDGLSIYAMDQGGHAPSVVPSVGVCDFRTTSS